MPFVVTSPSVLSAAGERGRAVGRETRSLSAKMAPLLCDVYSARPQNHSNKLLCQGTSMRDEEEEKLQMFAIEHLQWLVIQEAWPLLLKCGPESIRGIIRVVRAN